MKSSPKRHNFRYRRLLIVLAIGMVVVPCILYSLGGESRAPVSPAAVDPAPKATLDQTIPKEKAKAEVPPQHPRKKVKIPQQVVPPTVFSTRAAYSLLWRQKTRLYAGSPVNWAPVLCSKGQLLPSLFLIGGTKAGTTSLFHGFSEATSFLQMGNKVDGEAWWARKEKFFWSQRYNKGQDWYLQHYPECPGAASKAIKGKWNVYVPLVAPQPPVFQVAADMTANVFQTTNAPARIKQAYGPLARKVSFLIMIKASAAQATRSSMYMSMREENLVQNPANFRKKVFNEVAAARACHKEFLDSGSNDDQFSSFYAKDCERLGTHNLRQAAYAPLLRHWLGHFEPDQFVLISSEAYFAAPEEVVSELSEHLGVPYELDEVDFTQKLGDQRWNNGNDKKPPMKQEDMGAFAHLKEYFEPLAAELSDLLVKHVKHGKMKFIGDMEPFMRSVKSTE